MFKILDVPECKQDHNLPLLVRLVSCAFKGGFAMFSKRISNI